MIKSITLLQLTLFLFTITSCKNEESKKIEILNTPISSKIQNKNNEELIEKTEPIKTPESFNILFTLKGDLDKDGISEKIIVYNTEKETDFGNERQLYIYKNTNHEWLLWKKSATAILSSAHGGMMGDPFESVSIERNCLVINHFGGSRHKWNYIHRYRYQSGDFQLIGATVYYGAPCDYFETFDYNLSNGKIDYTKETEDCEKKSSKKREQKND